MNLARQLREARIAERHKRVRHLGDFENDIRGRAIYSFLYKVNDKQQTLSYYLADKIHPSWRIFIIAMSGTRGMERCKELTYSMAQEAFRKDTEHAFGLIIIRIHISKPRYRLRYTEDLTLVMETCNVLQNIIVKYRKDGHGNWMWTLQHYEDEKRPYSKIKNLCGSWRAPPKRRSEVLSRPVVGLLPVNILRIDLYINKVHSRSLTARSSITPKQTWTTSSLILTNRRIFPTSAIGSFVALPNRGSCCFLVFVSHSLFL